MAGKNVLRRGRDVPSVTRGSTLHASPADQARHVVIQGIVQGVGFRPFVYRLARQHGIRGWVLNAETGVQIHAEGDAGALEIFIHALESEAPPAASISSLAQTPSAYLGFDAFEIRESQKTDQPTVRISPDLPVCEDCLRELFDAADRRLGYPYINCTNCGPRYSIILSLPYDRPKTTMGPWPLCDRCEREYTDPANRRFHAQPVACSTCGPRFTLRAAAKTAFGREALQSTVDLLCEGGIVAMKGLGGYHLACDATQEAAVARLRTRKYRKERPFAVMVRDLQTARDLIETSPDVETLLTSIHRPIVLAPAKRTLSGVAPGNRELGVMLAYTPLQHLLFALGAPPVLVMTSANRSSEPIAYEDEDALARLAGIADAFLVGERPIARRIDDSIARVGPAGAVVLRHARGYAPRAVAQLPVRRPILAVGADLKNAIALVVDGQTFMSQHIGDLDEYAVFESFKAAIRDLCDMYEVEGEDVTVVHDGHPEYASTIYAQSLSGECVSVQHHRAHIGSVLAEREAFDESVIGLAFDGTGFGDDGTIWGGEIFTGSLRDGLSRAMSLRTALLPGGDAAARHPVVAAAGFLAALDGLPDLTGAPFEFPPQYRKAVELVAKNVRTFVTTSMGRLFDTVAALLGFTREISFEGQAAIWLEQLAWTGGSAGPYEFPVRGATLDYRPLLAAVIADRLRGRERSEIAYAFHAALANACIEACNAIPDDRIVVASGGVFQNALLVQMLADRLGSRLWLNAKVPPNDGGIALGQAAIAALGVVH
jgi:hydrogenase maturation protein HypF